MKLFNLFKKKKNEEIMVPCTWGAKGIAARMELAYRNNLDLDYFIISNHNKEEA